MPNDVHEVEVSCRLAYRVDEPATFVLAVAPSRFGQELLDETWSVDTGAPVTELATGGPTRLHRVAAQPGPLSIRYTARVRTRVPDAVLGDGAGPTGEGLTPELLELLRPSRYAPSDLIADTSAELFAAVPPGADTALAVAEWIHRNVAYVSGATDVADSAVETLRTRQGVCRDFVHLGLALARSVQLPARYVSAYAPLVQPPDFHAALEVHVGGRWWVLDPTRLAPRPSLVRIGTGRDAADCAFATILDGWAEGTSVEVSAVTVGPPPADDHTGLLPAPA